MGLGDLVGDVFKGAKNLVGHLADPVGGVPGAQSLEDLKNFALTPVTLARDVFTAPMHEAKNGDPLAMMGALVQAFGSAAGHLAAPIGDGIDQFAAELGWGNLGSDVNAGYTAASKGIDRGVSSLALLADPDVELNPLTAWRTAKNVSPGQAIIHDVSHLPFNPFMHGGSILDGNLDITDPDDREKMMTGAAGRVAVQTVDTVLRFFDDPTVIGGKALGASRASAIVKPIKTVEDVNKAASVPRVQRGAQTLADMTPEQRAYSVSRMPDLAGNAAAQHLIASGTTASEILNSTRLLVDPNPALITRMQLDETAAYQKVKEIRDTSIPTIKASLAQNRAGGAQLVAGDPTVLQGYLAQANHDLGQAMDEASKATARARGAGTLKTVPRFDPVSLGRNHMGPGYEGRPWDPDQGPQWDVSQPSKYGYAARVLRSAGQRRFTQVRLDRPGDATAAAAAMMDRVGHGWGISQTAADLSDRFAGTRLGQTSLGQKLTPDTTTVRSSGIDAETRGRILAGVQQAELVSPQAAADAVHEAEVAVWNWYAARMPGVNGTGIPEAARDSIIKTAHERRNLAIGQFLGGDSGQFSAVANPARPGTFLDEFTDPSANAKVGDKIRSPLTTSDLQNTLPMLDVDGLAREMRLHAQHMDAQDWQDVAEGLRVPGDESTLPMRMSAIAIEQLNNINKVWKPATLLRLGWPIHIATDETARIIAMNGVMSHLPLLLESAGVGIKSSRGAAKLVDMTRYRARAAARTGLESLEPSRLANEQSLSYVEQIRAASDGLDGLNAEITTAGGELQAAADAVDGDYVYRNAPKGAQHRSARGGVTFSTKQPAVIPPGEMTHARLVPPGTNSYFPTATDTVAGVAALRDFTTPAEFDALQAFTNRELRAYLEQEGGFPAGQYKSREQLLSALGAVKARDAGFQAITHGDQFVALHPAAVKVANHDPVYAASAKLNDLLGEHLVLTKFHDDLTGKLAAEPPWAQDMHEKYSQLLAKAKSRSESYAERSRTLPFTGSHTTTTPSGATYEFNDFAGGEHGPIRVKLTGSGADFQTLARTQDQYVNGIRMRAGDVKTLSPVPDSAMSVRAAKASDLAYRQGWEAAVNRQIAANPLGMQILRGKTDPEILAWIKDTSEGQTAQRMVGLAGRDPAEWVSRVRQQVNSYLPTKGLQDSLVAAKDAGQDLRAATLYDQVKDPATRPMIHGESLDAELGQSYMSAQSKKFVDWAYHAIGTMPVDILTRQPYAAAIYRRSLDRQMSFLPQGEEHMVTPELMTNIERRATQETVKQVQDTMWNLSNETHLAYSMRFIAPFFTAWSEALRSWGNLFLEDPSRLSKLLQVSTAPQRIGFNPNGQNYLTRTDEHGNTTLDLWLPKTLQNLIGVKTIGVPTKYVQNLIYSPEFGYLPGMGLPVTVPLAAMVRDKPDLYSSVKALMPYGAGRGILDNILPSDIKKLTQAQQQDEDSTFTNAKVRIFRDLETDRSLGKNQMSDQGLQDEATRRAKAFGWLQVVSSVLSPFSQTYNSPYQFYWDEAAAMRQDYTTHYGSGLNAKDANGQTWDQAFLAKYGDAYFAMTQSASKSNVGGIAPTDAGFQAQQKYSTDIAANPGLGALIAGDTTGGFSSEVLHYQEDNRISPSDSTPQRTVLDVKSALTQDETAQGWDKFRQMNAAINMELNSRGLRSISDKAAGDLLRLKQAAVAKLANDYPAWQQDYDTFTRNKIDANVAFLAGDPAKGTKGFLDKPGVIDRPGYATLAQYLAARQTMVNQLQARKMAGGSGTLDAIANADLKRVWDAVATTLQEKDTKFEDIYSRYFANDTLEAPTT